jgi:Cu/Ag efflux protein CusF
MKRVVFLLCLVILLTGCAGSGQSTNSSRDSLAKLIGEPVREASAYGFVTQVSVEEKIITIKHAPIPEMNWAPMVMPFRIVDDVDLLLFKRGDKVAFVLEIDKEDNYRIKTLSHF